MSLRNKITRAVDKAFDKVGDLAETVTLKVTSSEEYDFSTGATTKTEVESSVKAIIVAIEEDPNQEVIGAPKKEVYIKEKDLTDPKIFDTITIASQDHSILSYKLEPGLVTLLVTEG